MEDVVNHAEAFKLMNYRCEDCGRHEVLWNSRDGVTPFYIDCPGCGDGVSMRHVDWHLDRYAPLFIPSKGQRYFADMTRERAREHANRNADMFVSVGRIEQADRNRVADRLFTDYFGNGHQPDILEAA